MPRKKYPPHPIPVHKEEISEDWMNEVRLRAAESPKDCLERSRPQVAAQALWMLSQAIPKKRIAEQLGIDRGTIRALEWRHNDTLESKRKEFSREYAMVAMTYKNLLFMKAEQLEDDPEQLKLVSPDKLALTMAISTDKAMALSGMAGVVIEHRKGASIDDAAFAIAAAKARVAEKIKAQAIEAEIIGE